LEQIIAIELVRVQSAQLEVQTGEALEHPSEQKTHLLQEVWGSEHRLQELRCSEGGVGEREEEVVVLLDAAGEVATHC
jgi:hypothetical protein